MIRISNVSKTFGRTPVLDALSLSLAPGERVALIGGNGAGKTTLIRCLLGQYVHRGEVRIDGLPVRSRRREVLRRVGFVPQSPPPLKQPVGQLLKFAARVCSADVEAMIGVSTRLGLDPREVWRQAFVRLSGGQKQKLLIAIALGREADLLLLDEPAANLDPEGRAIFFRLLAERDGRDTVLLSSHRLDEVAALVSRVIELDRGRIVADHAVEHRCPRPARSESE